MPHREIEMEHNKNWEDGEPIEKRPGGIHNGHWYPAIEIYQNDPGVQKFIIHDETSTGRWPVDRVADSSIDLTDPQVLIDQWRDIKKDIDRDSGNE